MSVRVLSLPDWTGPGPAAWQRAWERLDARVQRVEQASWTEPSLAAWSARVIEALEATPSPAVLLGHGLGAALIAHVARSPSSSRVAGALLVAPPQCATPALPPAVRAFDWPMVSLPFPSIVVASEDDPHGSLGHTTGLARLLGARLVNVGARGHLDGAALGAWPEGWELLRALRAGAPFELDPRLARDTTLVAHGASSELLLFNEARWPWLVLVPRQSGAEDPGHLSEAERRQLADESAIVCDVLRERFGSDKVNVGALGNVVRQLHVHHVGRRLDDPAWPGPVWGHSPREPMTPAQRAERVSRVLSDERVRRVFVPV
ncbi:MAG: alpha/beta hydrolase [Myxococcaceae bacterium]|nr:alpha/beta hydrolase [Myxococcaceae bacterium]